MKKDSPWVRVAAPCKVNLALAVLGRRDDGYHEIETEVVAVDLIDVVALRARPSASVDVRLEIHGPAASEDVPRDRTNLVVAALERYAAALGRSIEFEVRLEKRIPSRAGLGGGSSDAAAALLAARFALGAGPAPADELAILAELGSDTVFFAAAERTGHAVARGRGERVEVLPPLEPLPWVALCTPGVEAATSAVYAASGLAPGAVARPPRESWTAAAEARDVRTLRASASNDLERAALAAYPALARWREHLDATELGHWRLAGSGATWFGLYPDERAARQGLAVVESLAVVADLSVRALHAARLADRGRWRIDDDRERVGGDSA